MTKNGVKSKIDIAVLEIKMDEICEKVSRIENNELPHIKEKLEKIDNKNAYYNGGLAMLIIAIELFLHFLK